MSRCSMWRWWTPKGLRCPTDAGRIDFTCTGPAIWRGGYNSGVVDSTNNLYLSTELGINRVAVRSNAGGWDDPSHRQPREGLRPAEAW
jgi:beta-galactosidase